MKKYVESNKHYSHMIESVGVYGAYQKQFAAVVILAWVLLGLYETSLITFFDLGDPSCLNIGKMECIRDHMCQKDFQDFSKYFPKGKPETIPYELGIQCDFQTQYILSTFDDLAPILGLLIGGWLSTKFGIKKVLIFSNILMTLGTLILLCVRDVSGVMAGILVISLPHYTIGVLLLSIVPEVTNERISAWIVVAAMLGFRLGRFVMGCMSIATTSYKLLLVTLLLPIAILSLFLHCYYYESPRHLIDNDIFKGLQVLQKIARKNNSQYEQIDIENSFITSKISLKLYSYRSLFFYRSLRLKTYSFCLIMAMMGILSNYPIYVLEQRLGRGYQEMAMGGFAFFSLLPCFLFIEIYYRKFLSALIGMILLILCLLVPFVSETEQWSLYKIIMLGLACITLSILSAFMTTFIMESFPHTVRALAMALLFSCFLFGRFLQGLFQFQIDNKKTLGLLFIESSFIMLFHMIPLKQTIHEQFPYDVEELNEENEEDAIFQN